MTLAHGSVGYADEAVLLVPVVVLLVLAVSWLRGYNARRAASRRDLTAGSAGPRPAAGPGRG